MKVLLFHWPCSQLSSLFWTLIQVIHKKHCEQHLSLLKTSFLGFLPRYYVIASAKWFYTEPLSSERCNPNQWIIMFFSTYYTWITFQALNSVNSNTFQIIRKQKQSMEVLLFSLSLFYAIKHKKDKYSRLPVIRSSKGDTSNKREFE